MINNVVLMGRLTHEPELRVTPNNISVVRFGLAVERSYSTKGEERKTDFVDVTAWRQTAEFICRYFHKGSMIALQGAIQTDNYTDKDGNKRKSVQVVADGVSFCGSKAENEGKEAPYTPQVDNAPKAVYKGQQPFADFEEILDDDDDDLPF